MAIFSKKKNTAETKVPVKTSVKTSPTQMGNKTPSVATDFSYGFLLRRPRITEKASFKAESENTYVFEVEKSANKKTIALAVKELYKVNPVKVTIVRIPSKQVFVRGKKGVKSGGKKAYIFLKKGEKIEVV